MGERPDDPPRSSLGSRQRRPLRRRPGRKPMDPRRRCDLRVLIEIRTTVNKFYLRLPLSQNRAASEGVFLEKGTEPQRHEVVLEGNREKCKAFVSTLSLRAWSPLRAFVHACLP